MKNSHLFYLVGLSLFLLSALLQAKTILPGVDTRVVLSAKQVNDVHCADGDLEEITYLDQYGLIDRISEIDPSHGYIGFQQAQNGYTRAFQRDAVTINIICGGKFYKLLGMPNEDVEGQSVYLVANDAEAKAADYYRKKTRPEVLVDVIQQARKAHIQRVLKKQEPEISKTWEVKEKDILISRVYEKRMRGSGFTVQQLLVTARSKKFKHVEKDYLDTAFGKFIVAVDIDDYALSPGDSTFVYIVTENR